LQKLKLMEQVCNGLSFAHSKGIVHRDLKPGNIHILPGSQVKVMDFGLARLASSDMTRTGLIMGTPDYMSPEQVQAQRVDARSDVFSLGAVFYELLTERKPFHADSIHATMFKVVQGKREPITQSSELPAGVIQLVDKALSMDPAERFQNAGEMRDALRAIINELGQSSEANSGETDDLVETLMAEMPPVDSPAQPISASSPVPSAQVQPPSSRRTVRKTQQSASRRGPRILAVAAAAVCLVIVGGLMLLRSSPDASSARSEPLESEATVGGDAEAPSQALEMARQSLDNKDYQGVVQRADLALEQQPGNAEALAIRNEAQSTLAELEAAVREARAEVDRRRNAALSAGAGSLAAFVQAEQTAGEAEAELSRREFALAFQKFSSARDGFARAHRDAKQQAEKQAQAAAARTELQQVSVQWSELQGQAQSRIKELGPQTSYQAALSLESEAQRLTAAGDYSSATRAYRDAIAGLRDALAGADRGRREREADAEMAAAASARLSPPRPETSPPPPPAPSTVSVREMDEQQIRDVIADWERAIETEDIALYRSVKPNLSGEDENRLKASFQAVTSHRVEIAITAVAVQGDRAMVRLAREDEIEANGRRHSNAIDQTLSFSKQSGRWVIVEIGQ
jgi:ketosteroid isomerase-like protein